MIRRELPCLLTLILSVGAFSALSPIPAFKSTAFAASGTPEAEQAKNELQRLSSLLQSTEKYTERVELARLFVLKQSIETVLASIEKYGMGHMQTIRDYQSLIVAFRFSGEFFTRVQTDNTRAAIQEALQISQHIAEARGFDDSPYTQITKSIFSQMKKLIDDLQGVALPPALLEKLYALRPGIGDVIAIASQGDRPKAFAAASALHSRIIALYPEFSTIAIANPAFEIILNIQGLNEFYAEFAQLPPTL